jgi:hypothetical protein
MFIQVFHGKVSDPDLVRRMDERWLAELKPGAKGYLGYTGGITPDGHYIGMARFESAELAQANSDRPEQTAWWNEAAKGFEGEPAFFNCTEVDTPFGGGSNDAAFVQIIQGRAKDPERLRSMSTQMEKDLREQRPDILGMVIAWHGDGNDFTQAVYFKSEAETRKLEKATESSETRQAYVDMFESAPTFYDLKEPVLD